LKVDRMNILVFPAMESARVEKLTRIAGTSKIINATTVEQAAAIIPDVDGFLGKITPALLEKATRLKWVQSMTVSLEHYVFPELIGHPCELTNMRGIFSDAVADHTFAMILTFSRRIAHYVLAQSQGKWSPLGGEHGRVDFSAGPGVTNAIDLQHEVLSEKTLGVFGLGGIGGEIARRGHAFGMKVLGLDPFLQNPCPGIPEPWGMERLDEFLGLCDYLVIAAPHTPLTQGMFNKMLFQKMRKNIVLINIGRGAIVVLADLVEALNLGWIRGAGLDVYEKEPLDPASPLWRMGEKVLLTPHVAGYAPPIALRHFAIIEENLKRFLSGQPLMNVVEKSRWF